MAAHSVDSLEEGVEATVRPTTRRRGAGSGT
jgi:hypothetical protein